MLDTVHTWDRPVTIKLEGVDHVVASPVQARHVLLVDWPAERTDKHKAASQACLAAIEGASAEVAWAAFLDAALEAGIFVD
jgi:hypothetical protein